MPFVSLSWFPSHPKELGNISQTPDESDRRRNETARQVDDDLWSSQPDVTAAGAHPTSACRKNVLHPLGVGSVGEHKDVVITAAEHVDRRMVGSSRFSPRIS